MSYVNRTSVPWYVGYMPIRRYALISPAASANRPTLSLWAAPLIRRVTNPWYVLTSLEAARGNRLEALYVLAVTAGLRIGELLGLIWEDIDLDAETLRVRRTKSRAKTGPIFTAPKNGKGRQLRLTRRAVESLKSHKAAQNAERLGIGDLWQDNGLVFCTMGGKPLDFQNLRATSFKPLLKKAGLPDIRFHDLRHTCATAATLPRPPSQVGARAAGPLVGGDDAGPLQSRPARYGRLDCGRYGGCSVLKTPLSSVGVLVGVRRAGRPRPSYLTYAFVLQKSDS